MYSSFLSLAPTYHSSGPATWVRSHGICAWKTSPTFFMSSFFHSLEPNSLNLSTADTGFSADWQAIGIGMCVAMSVTSGVQSMSPGTSPAGIDGGGAAAGAAAAAATGAPEPPGVLSKAAFVSGVARPSSSFTLGSMLLAVPKASLAPARSFLPLPRTRPTYIQALALVAGLH